MGGSAAQRRKHLLQYWDGEVLEDNGRGAKAATNA
jgi:hypothetical protein